MLTTNPEKPMKRIQHELAFDFQSIESVHSHSLHSFTEKELETKIIIEIKTRVVQNYCIVFRQSPKLIVFILEFFSTTNDHISA